jgi:hypothetical protein
LAIERRQQDLNERFRGQLHLNADQARALSLILFGDVLFDRWQTRNLGQGFPGGNASPRDGKIFFLAGLEKVPGKIGSLGMYTHAESRHEQATVLTYGHAAVPDPFAEAKPEDVQHLIESYVAFVQGGATVEPVLRDLGLVRDGEPTVAVISQSLYARLSDITKTFTDELLRLLNGHRAEIADAYRRSRLAHGVSFQEFAL